VGAGGVVGFFFFFFFFFFLLCLLVVLVFSVSGCVFVLGEVFLGFGECFGGVGGGFGRGFGVVLVLFCWVFFFFGWCVGDAGAGCTISQSDVPFFRGSAWTCGAKLWETPTSFAFSSTSIRASPPPLRVSSRPAWPLFGLVSP